MAPSTPPPPARAWLAAFTTASTSSRVMSPSTGVMRMASSSLRRFSCHFAGFSCVTSSSRGYILVITSVAVADTRGGRPMERVVSKVDVFDRSWQDQANCLGVDPDLFFPERGASTREAKEVCRGCVVRLECLEYALANGEKFGIWGGMSERERRRIRRARALARRQGGIASA